MRPDAWREVVLTAIPEKYDKVGFCSMRYISLLPVIQKVYTRALQSAVRRENHMRQTSWLWAREIHCSCHCNIETSAEQSC